MPRPRHLSAAFLALLPALGAAAQCDLLIKEDFRLGDRPSGNRGRVRPALLHDHLNDFWTPIPGDASVRWASAEAPSFNFAASSVDPLEWPEDPAFPEGNGTAFGEHGAAAVLPFSIPATRFVASIDAVPIYGLDDGILFGFSRSAATSANFAAGGELWARYAGTGAWELHSRTGGLLASGLAGTGTALTGFTPVSLEVDPPTRRVRLAVNHEVVADLTLDADPVPTTLVMEADAPFTNWQVANNLIVRQGGLDLFSAAPAAAVFSAGGDLTMAAASDAVERTAFWFLDGVPLSDGPGPLGEVHGARTLTLTVSAATAAAAGRYRCTIVTPCGSWSTPPADATLRPGCPADFNADGFLDFFDYDDFVGCFETGACPPGAAADFNQDGFADFFDYDDFVLAYEQGC